MEKGAEAMSGHSKWHQIRRQKGVNDSRRGALFTRLGREMIVAVREGGGGDPDANFRLRMAIQRARDANMPMDNIDRTIKRATGAEGGASFDEIVYEGYAPGGAAIMIQAMTDNRNRTVAEMRNTLNKNGGNLGEAGCVDWIFEQTGIIEVTLEGHDPDELTLMAIDAGAQDVDDADGWRRDAGGLHRASGTRYGAQSVGAQKLNWCAPRRFCGPRPRSSLTKKRPCRHCG